MKRFPRTTTAVALAAAALALVAAVPGSSSGATRSSRSTSLSLVGYSTPKAAYGQLIASYQKTPTGSAVKFSQSFGASTDQARAIVQGLPADVINLSLASDMQTLVDAHLISKNWNRTTYNGMVTNSIVTFLVRKGNPKNIKTWADLVKPGIQVVQPNPISSGGARWDVMAAYGQALAQKQTPKQAQTYLTSYFHNVVSQDKSAAAAMNTFLSGKGDVLVGYESEALPAIAAGNPVELVRPSYTLLIQNPIAVSGATKDPTDAKAFVHYLLSPPAQTIWAQDGYRPVDPTVFAKFKKSFPTPHGLFKITDFGLGGWNAVTAKFFDPANGLVSKIESGL
ncbi:MAG TPA: sulfate ABC transporter substrate-binding protein [Gaiellales bacterium]|jgi:sulfate transport system substrate-binding protein